LIRLILALAAALAALAGHAFASGDVKPSSFPTNLEMLEDVARLVVEESAGKVPLESGQTVLVMHTGEHEAAWIVENYLAGRLAALGASVYLAVTAVTEESESPAQGEAEDSGADLEGTIGRRRAGAQGEAAAEKSEGETGPAAAAGRDTIAAPVREVDDPDAWPPKSFYLANEDSLREAAPGDEVPLSDEVAKSPGRAGTEAADGSATAPAVPAASAYGDAPQPNRVLEFRIGELDVAYTRKWRKSLFGTAMVERSARAAVFFRLMDAKDGKVLWADSGRLEKRDVVPENLLAELEDTPDRPGARGAASGGLGRVIEPIVVSGIVVGLVVLFYSSRS
jgi:hypothetical protein